MIGATSIGAAPGVYQFQVEALSAAKQRKELEALHANSQSSAGMRDYRTFLEDNPELAIAWRAELAAKDEREDRVWRRRLGLQTNALRAVRRDASPLVAAFLRAGRA